MTEQERQKHSLALRAFFLGLICTTRKHLGPDDPQWREADEQLRALVPEINGQFGDAAEQLKRRGEYNVIEGEHE